MAPRVIGGMLGAPSADTRPHFAASVTRSFTDGGPPANAYRATPDHRRELTDMSRFRCSPPSAEVRPIANGIALENSSACMRMRVCNNSMAFGCGALETTSTPDLLGISSW